MARKFRVQYPGAIYHVMNRGGRREAERAAPLGLGKEGSGIHDSIDVSVRRTWRLSCVVVLFQLSVSERLRPCTGGILTGEHGGNANRPRKRKAEIRGWGGGLLPIC